MYHQQATRPPPLLFTVWLLICYYYCCCCCYHTGVFGAPADIPASIPSHSTRYNDHLVIRVSNPHILSSKSLELLDVWSEHVAQHSDGSGNAASTLDINLRQGDLDHLQQEYDNKLQYTIIHSNVQNVIDQERKSFVSAAKKVNTLVPNISGQRQLAKLVQTRSQKSSLLRAGEFGANLNKTTTAGVDSLWHLEYHPLSEMAWFFVNLAQNYSDIVKLQPSIGKTVEGRDIFAVFIGAKTSYKDEVSQLSESTQLKSRMVPFSSKPDSTGIAATTAAGSATAATTATAAGATTTPAAANTTSTATTNQSSNSGVPSSTVYIQCLQHAREWISGAVCTYLADALVRGYTSQNSRITSILNSTQVVLVPVINADGYVYSWEVDRLWRKSRKVNDDGSVGVDTNRNWPFHFGEQGASSQGSSEVFHGSRAGSEPEVQAVVSFYSSLPRKVGAIDMHAYSQLILRPYAFTSSPNPDDDSLNNIATKMADAIKGVRGTKYENLATNTGLYPASGVAGDWFNQREPDGSGGLGVHSLTIELSPAVGSNGGGLAGFQLPPEQIRKVGAEVTEGILTFIEEAVAHPLNSNTKD